MLANGISFKSRINIVTEREFKKLATGEYIDISESREDIKKVVNENIRTEDVRSCVAGAAINTKTKEAVGFHFYDCRKNYRNAKKRVDEVMDLVPGADRVLLLGGKKTLFSRFSIPLFKATEDEFKKRVENVTTFEQHKIPLSQSKILYSAKNDEWFINTVYSKSSPMWGTDVTSEEELLENFNRIKTAEGDYIYINGKQIVL